MSGWLSLGRSRLVTRYCKGLFGGIVVQDVRRAFRLLKEADIQVGLQLMPGLPGETSGSFPEALMRLLRLNPILCGSIRRWWSKIPGWKQLYRAQAASDRSPSIKPLPSAPDATRKLTEAGIGWCGWDLQPSDSLEKSVVAGPYHPAFGELVQSRLWLKKIRARLAASLPGRSCRIHISHRDMSAVVGMRQQNIKRLEELGFSGRFTILPDKNMARGSIHYAVC